MQDKGLLDNILGLKAKFKQYFVHRKKLKALQLYATVHSIHHNQYLILIKRCMDSGFLDEREADFLSYMIEKYFSEENFLDWTHKTRWLKEKIMSLSQESKRAKIEQLTMFDYSKLDTKSAPNVPLELLGNKAAKTMRASK